MKHAWLALLAPALAGCSIADVHFTNGNGDANLGDAHRDAPLPLDGPPPAAGGYYWVRSLSQVSTQTIVAGPNSVVTPGYLSSTADLGMGAMTSAGGADQIVAAFAEDDASDLFAARHGTTGNEFGLFATIDSTGAPIVSGVTTGTVDLGLGAGAGGGATDGYIGRYAGGVATWVDRIVGSGGNAKIFASPRGPGATVWAAGWWEGTSTLSGAGIPTPISLVSAGNRDIFFALVNTFSGAIQAGPFTFGGAGQDQLSGGAGPPNDSSTFVLSGFFANGETLSFGGTAAPIASTHGGVDVWIAKFDATGAGVWAQAFGGTGDDQDPAVAVDAAGDVYVTGTFNVAITFGSTTLTAVGGAGSDHFITKLRGTDGSPVWAISFGTIGDETGGQIAVDNAGHVAFSGPLAGAFEGGTTNGGVDALTAELNASDGTLVWQHVYSTSGDDRGGGVAYAANGALYAAITLGGPFDFGQPVIGDANPVGVVMKIEP